MGLIIFWGTSLLGLRFKPRSARPPKTKFSVLCLAGAGVGMCRIAENQPVLLFFLQSLESALKDLKIK